MFSALSSCNVTEVVEVHDETGTISSSQSTDQIVQAFYAIYVVDGNPTIYSTSSIKGHAIYPPSLLLSDVIIRVASTDGFNYIWMNVHQDETSMDCLSTTFPLNSTTNYNCTGQGWYLTAPFCRTYSCTQGIDFNYYSAYSNYLALYTGNYKGKFYGAKLSVADINAVYSGVIGALVAVIIGTVSYFAAFFFTE